ncbi:MAG: S8 family peptidase [Bacteroidia bacterium]|jgi:hypothetical protein|nr:S8 family peptidase [Bacteroidia bacterium]
MKRIYLACLLAIVVLTGNSQTGDTLPLYQDGRLYFQLKLTSNVTIKHQDTILNDPGGSFQALFTKYQVVKTELPYAILNTPELNKTYRVNFNQVARVDSFIIDLQLITTHVQYAEKVPAVYTFSVPNDPLSVQNSTYLPTFYHLPLLNADQASNIHISNTVAVVAIVDDAVLTTHDDLAANIGTLNVGWDASDNDSDPNPPFSGNYAAGGGVFTHGTHVAGIAGAVTNNSIGIASIGWNNKLMCVKTASSNVFYGGLHNAMDGVAWAAANGAHVINMSFGGGFSQADYNVIVAAKNNNIVLIAAAGNAMTNLPFYPAAYGEGTTGQPWEIIDKKLVVAVSALDQTNNISYWSSGFGSNYGYWVDISAYGTDIESTLAASAGGTAITNQYGQVSGTSMAAPMIAGIAGIMRSYDMSKTANEIIDCLINTANPDIYGTNHPLNIIGSLGTGRADAAAALRCISSDCSVNPIAIIVPSSPSLCANTTLTLTANSGAVSYSWSTGATTQSIVVNTPGVYSLTAVHLAHCTATASINFASPPTLSVALSTNTTICTGFSISMISAVGNYSSLIWQPGGMITNSIVVNPTSYTVYSVTANPWCGGSTATIGVNPTGSPQPPYNAYSVLSPTLVGNYAGPTNSLLPSGHFIINADAIVNTSATFYYSDVLISPNVKISVPSGSSLHINLAHLKTCGVDMWQGIVLADGSKILCENQSFVEDAITAISSTHTPLYSSGLAPAIITVKHTVFNKNYIDIALTDYYDFLSTPLTYSSMLDIEGCVFTCRNFTLPWVSAGFSTPSGSYGLGIRYVASPTTGLAPPYITQTYSITTLKAPYSTQSSKYAIKLSNVGITSGNTFNGVQIGKSTFWFDYNLFDAHENFVNSKNSNVKCVNNVFQNSILDPFGGQFNPNALQNGTGTAILHLITSNLNAQLDLSASSSSTGNRFWNCHRAIEGINTYKFDFTNGLIRGNQTSTTTALSQAKSGILISTNRFLYYIGENEFSNLHTCINIPISSGTYTSAATGTVVQPGIYASKIAIIENTFAPQPGTLTNSTSIGNNYVNYAINVSTPMVPVVTTPTSPLSWVVASVNVTPAVVGLVVQRNMINRVFRGVYFNGISGAFPNRIEDNNIILQEDNMSTNSQAGVYVVNNSGSNVISSNTLSGIYTGATATSNSLVTLVHSGNNTQYYIAKSPSVSCNDLSNAYRGFNFNSANHGAAWMGNTMDNLARGMVLSGGGIIGVQGSTNNPSDNQWTGGAFTGTLNGTYVDGSSNAVNSKLWVKNTGNYVPQNAGFVSMNLSYAIATNTPNTSGAYSCGGAASVLFAIPSFTDYETEDMAYIARYAFYTYLNANDSVKESDGNFVTFFEDHDGTSFDIFTQVEENLYLGNLTSATSLLSGFTSTNTVEGNYKSYYELYIAFAENNFLPTNGTDSTALFEIAALCPAEYGACVYQARALYERVFGGLGGYSDDCLDEGARMIQSNLSNGVKGNFDVFPNPAINEILVYYPTKDSETTLEISDLSGRVIYSKKVVFDKGYTDVEFNLKNGIYFIAIKEERNGKLVKKLVVVN